jgi:hypothetical protein
MYAFPLVGPARKNECQSFAVIKRLGARQTGAIRGIKATVAFDRTPK